MFSTLTANNTQMTCYMQVSNHYLIFMQLLILM